MSSKDWQGKSFQGEMHLKEMIWQFRFCFCWHRQIFTATFSLSLVCADWRWSPYSFLSFFLSWTRRRKNDDHFPLPPNFFGVSFVLIQFSFLQCPIFKQKLSSCLATIYHWVTFLFRILPNRKQLTDPFYIKKLRF